jgi:uncharacterized sulfatase
MVALALPFACGLLAPLPAGALPNIVLIFSDDHNWRDYSFTGENPWVTTPNLDQLAAEGVMIRRGYVPTSLCRPSLAALFTGLHAVRTGITGNDPAPTGSRLRNELAQSILRRGVEVHATLPRLLGELGYRSLQTGKWWEGDFRRAGFTDGATADRHKSLGRSNFRSIGRGGLEPIETFVRQAVADGAPFFVSYAPKLPHVPHNAPRAFREVYDDAVASGELTRNEAKYYASVDWFDSTVGELREIFRTVRNQDGRPLEDETLFVYAVDNGWAPEPEGLQTSRGSHDAKRAPSEDGVRGPIVLYWKGEIFDERSVVQKLGDTRLASTLDLMPTLLSLLGAGSLRPDLAPGIDLLGEARNELFGDTYGLDVPVATADGFVYDDRESVRTSRWMIQGRYKLILPDGEHFGGSPQLYDLLADPGEHSDLAKEQSERVERMSARIEAWWRGSRPLFWYGHEFEDDDGPLADRMPDVSLRPGEAVWRTVGEVAADGSIGPAGAAALAFEPEPGRRYELRAAGHDVAIGFSGEPLAAARDAVGPLWADAPAARGSDAPDAPAVALVLESDPGGGGWTIEHRVDGVVRSRERLDAAPRVRSVMFAARGEHARIDWIQLVETPRFESLAWRRGDTNGDGAIDLDDFATIYEHFTGAQPTPPRFAKTLSEGDVDGDGDVDWDDAWEAASALARGVL